MIDQETFNKLADGMEQVNRKMVDEMSRAAPYCHCRKMGWYSEQGSSWWECSVCGHTKDI